MVKIMVPNPIKMDDLGFFPLFLETPIFYSFYSHCRAVDILKPGRQNLIAKELFVCVSRSLAL